MLRRHSLYPAELRAHSIRIPYFRLFCAPPVCSLSGRQTGLLLPVPYPCSLLFRNSSITDWINAFAPSIPLNTACKSSAGFCGFRLDAQYTPCCPTMNERIGQQVQRHRQPPTLPSHHELVLFQLRPLLVKNAHALSLPETAGSPHRASPEAMKPAAMKQWVHRRYD